MINFYNNKKIFILLCFLFVFIKSVQAKTNTKAMSKNINEQKNQIDEKTLKFWERTFKYGTSSQKESIINYIKKRSIKQGEDIIVKYLKEEKNHQIIKLMISTLIQFTNKSVVSTVIELLNNTKDDNIKIFAVSSLGELKHKDTYKYVDEVLKSKNELLVEAALRALGDTEAVTMVDRLLKRFETEENPRLRTQLLLSLANIKSDKSQNTFISIFTNEEEKEINRAFSATGLGYIKNRKSYDILVKNFSKEPPNIKMRIIDAVGNLGYNEGIKLIQDSLKDDDKNIRIFSIRAIGKLKHKDSIEILKYKEEFDPEYKVRLEAKKVLKEMKGE